MVGKGFRGAWLVLFGAAVAVFIAGCGEEESGGKISVTITSPHEGDTISFPATITVDVTSDAAVVEVVFVAAGDTVGVDTDPPYAVEWTFCEDTGEVVVEVCASDEAGRSACDQINVYVPPPAGDFRLVVAAKSSHNVYLRWQEYSGSLFWRYRVYMSQRDTVDETDELVAELSRQADTTYLVDGLDPVQTYRFAVYAIPTIGETLVSNQVVVQTDEVPAPYDDGAEMVLIPAGEFTMGDSWHVGGSEEYPTRRVYLSAFYIYKYEVTCEQYKAFMDAGGYSDPEWWDTTGWRWKEREGITKPLTWNDPEYPCGDAYPDYPVTGVSWYEACAYARFVGHRLPTEAEWECAARGRGGDDVDGDGYDDGYRFPWGNEFFEGGTFHCNYLSEADGGEPDGFDDGYPKAAPVGTYPSGASPFGLMDMAGNASEWCLDWFEAPYNADDTENPQGPATGSEKVYRGGSYILDSGGAIAGFSFRTMKRFRTDPENQKHYMGFRLVEPAE